MEKILDDLLKLYGMDRILSHLIEVSNSNWVTYNEGYQKTLRDNLLTTLEGYRNRYKEEEKDVRKESTADLATLVTVRDQLNNLIAKKEENVCRCGQPGEEEHTCPFAEDIHGDSKTLCNCCSDCSYQCAMDI